ncbi:MAG: hypothetical protein NTV01_12225 [Bacteroidia bacterium]|nr:hypothetical protein [Bacteroidia bacterium]
MNERMQPTGTTMGSSLIGEYAYNSYGYPTSRKARVGTAYRQDYRTAFNATTANPISRQDYLRSKSESFTFDTGLNRLTSVSGPQNLTMQYATNGN